MGTKKILVVDDEFMNIRMAERILKDDASLSVIRAMNKAEALDALGNNDISLILLDIRMPDCDGFDLYDEVHGKYDIPVVFMTADSRKETLGRIEELGMSVYLGKPLDPAKTKEAVYGMLGQK